MRHMYDLDLYIADLSRKLKSQSSHQSESKEKIESMEKTLDSLEEECNALKEIHVRKGDEIKSLQCQLSEDHRKLQSTTKDYEIEIFQEKLIGLKEKCRKIEQEIAYHAKIVEDKRLQAEIFIRTTQIDLARSSIPATASTK